MTGDRKAVFTRLPPKPDHPALELEVLDRWDREKTFLVVGLSPEETARRLGTSVSGA